MAIDYHIKVSSVDKGLIKREEKERENDIAEIVGFFVKNEGRKTGPLFFQ